MFLCNYCQIEHDDEMRSREHIIPEYLLNNSYSLPDVCADLNRFASLSFEQAFNADKFVKDVLNAFSPNQSNRAIYHGPLETTRGTVEHRYSRKGAEFLADQPSYDMTRKVRFEGKTATGETVGTEISLPFELICGASGSSLLLKKERILQRAENSLNEYIAKLWKKPSLNPEFEDFVKKNGIVLSNPPKLVPRIEENRKEGEVVCDILDQKFEINLEVYSKSFLKMGWTHVCKTLGRSVLNNPVGQWVFKFLFEGAIPKDVYDVLISEGTGHQEMFRGIENSGESFNIWTKPINECESNFTRMRTECPKAYSKLLPYFEYRKNRVECARRVVSFNREILLDAKMNYNEPENRVHRLSLKNETIDGKDGLICNIWLFGGTFDVDVQISNQHASISEELKVKEIRF